MELTISDKKYELQFGIKFINALDNLYTQEMEGLEFGVGVEMTNTYLNMGRPDALIKVIKAGTAHLKSKPSNEDVETYIEELANSDYKAYDKLFGDFQESMKQSPFLKRIMKGLQQI